MQQGTQRNAKKRILTTFSKQFRAFPLDSLCENRIFIFGHKNQSDLQVSDLAISLLRFARLAEKSRGLRPTDRGRAIAKLADLKREIARLEACRLGSAGLRPRNCPASICRRQTSRFPCSDPRDWQGNDFRVYFCRSRDLKREIARRLARLVPRTLLKGTTSIPRRPLVKLRMLAGCRKVLVEMRVRQLKRFPLKRTLKVQLRLLSLTQQTRPMMMLHQLWLLPMLTRSWQRHMWRRWLERRCTCP